MLTLAWTWLRDRAWVRWLVIAAGALIAGAIAYRAGRSAGADDEHDRQGEANRKALGETVRGDDALDARTEARAAETKAKHDEIDAKTEAALANPPPDDDAALAEARRMAAEAEAEERRGT